MQIAAAQVNGVIIRITRTDARQTYLVTVEDACSGIIQTQHTRAWPTEEQARAMARNAYRHFARPARSYQQVAFELDQHLRRPARMRDRALVAQLEAELATLPFPTAA
jgi:hypothetical protein